ncbi:NfeD family protein [uncultured Piscinibacter sp.]|uniref:NfeD family protein n=1 Tax=uncultured Piscinibacter sp. TaxID=1131835 RepID=UPI0026246DF7|nr:NfeD family protein [uncultured Piscinibacter sp.]
MLRWLASLLLAALGLMGVAAHFAVAEPAAARPIVYVLPIEGVIDLGLSPFVQRVIQEATEAGAAALILQIDTFGGRVDAAVQIRDALLDTPLRTVGFVNKRAISAGALIGLATQTLVMATGSTIGAAAPVHTGASGAEAKPADEKTVSYVRKEFRATAEARKRPLLLAEAMVDADVEVPGVVNKGKLLTLTTEEALKHKLVDFRADTLQGVLSQLGLEGAQVRAASPHWAEMLVRFLTHPVLSSLLISIGMLGIVLEMRTPGFGLAGALGVASLALFFWGHWLVQLAGWEEMLLAAVGLALLVAEVFFIPGFGIAGALGITALLAALVLSMTGTGDTAAVIAQAAWRVVIALLVALGVGIALLRAMPRMPFARRLVLASDLGTGPAHGSAPLSDQRWLGKQGRAASALRPAGIADIDGERVDVVSDGELVERGATIQVTHVDGNRIVVRRAHVTPSAPGSPKEE